MAKHERFTASTTKKGTPVYYIKGLGRMSAEFGYNWVVNNGLGHLLPPLFHDYHEEKFGSKSPGCVGSGDVQEPVKAF